MRNNCENIFKFWGKAPITMFGKGQIKKESRKSKIICREGLKNL